MQAASTEAVALDATPPHAWRSEARTVKEKSAAQTQASKGQPGFFITFAMVMGQVFIMPLLYFDKALLPLTHPPQRD